MYTGDHVVISAAVATIVSKRLRIKLVPIVTLFLLINLIDCDHAFYYIFETGAINSLTLYPLHVYAGCIIMLLFVVGLIRLEYMKYAFATIGGIALHLAADALAYWVHYQISVLLSFGLIELVVLYYVINRCVIIGNRRGFFLYIFACWLVLTAAQATVHFVLHIKPNENLIPISVATGLLAIVSVLFYFLFRNSDLATFPQDATSP